MIRQMRSVLRHPNYVASALDMTDDELDWAVNHTRKVQMTLQGSNTPAEETEVRWSVDLWKDHITSLMLLRDCLGREANRRGQTPSHPPMLARGWGPQDIYAMVPAVEQPDWLKESDASK